jgi:hypothetical protein
MLINITSTEQTIDIFISDGGASAVVGAGAWLPRGLPKRFRIFMHFRHVL